MEVDLPKIKQLRKDNGLSQQDMAYFLGYNTKWTYWRQETGVSEFTAVQLKKVAEIFQVPLESLYKKKTEEVAK